MLFMKERRPAFRTIEGWARSVCSKQAPSANAKSMGGRRTAWIRMPASTHFKSLGRIRPPASLRIMQSPLFAIC